MRNSLWRACLKASCSCVGHSQSCNVSAAEQRASHTTRTRCPHTKPDVCVCVCVLRVWSSLSLSVCIGGDDDASVPKVNQKNGQKS